MVYVRLYDLKDLTIELYGVMSDDRGQLLYVIDKNCQTVNLPTEHSFAEVVETPPCVQP